jgi:hypothetical protein
MSIKVTLNKLLSFIPNNDKEENLFKIDKTVLSDYLAEVIKSPISVFYLGGYIKLSPDDEINISQIEEIIKLNNRNIETQNVCNSWEMGSLFVCSKKIADTKLIVERYQEIYRLRQSETDV